MSAAVAQACAARAVLFDLDGTLLDTAPDLACALNRLRTEERLTPLPFAAIRPWASHGGRALVNLGFPDASSEEFATLLERLLVHYRECVADATQPFDGIAQLLETLERRQIIWGIVTNKPTWLTQPLLEALNLHARAGAVVCGDTLPERKPHPLPLLHAARLIEVAPMECLYVGDAERDVLAARAAGMRALVARFGYIGPQDQAQLWPAHGWIDSPLEVLEWLHR